MSGVREVVWSVPGGASREASERARSLVLTRNQLIEAFRKMEPERWEWRKRLYGRYDVRLRLHHRTGSLTVVYG